MDRQERLAHKNDVNELARRHLTLRRSSLVYAAWALLTSDILKNPGFRYWVKNQKSIIGYDEDDVDAATVKKELKQAQALFNTGVATNFDEAFDLVADETMTFAISGARDAVRDPNFAVLPEETEVLPLAPWPDATMQPQDWSREVESRIEELYRILERYIQ